MWEWLAGWGIAKLIGLLIVGLLVKPLLKFGFYIRQAVIDHRALGEFNRVLNEKLAPVRQQFAGARWEIAPELQAEVAAAKRRRIVGFVAAPLGILAILTFYAVLLPWWVAVLALALVGIGYFDVN